MPSRTTKREYEKPAVRKRVVIDVMRMALIGFILLVLLFHKDRNPRCDNVRAELDTTIAEGIRMESCGHYKRARVLLGEVQKECGSVLSFTIEDMKIMERLEVCSPAELSRGMVMPDDPWRKLFTTCVLKYARTF